MIRRIAIFKNASQIYVLYKYLVLHSSTILHKLIFKQEKERNPLFFLQEVYHTAVPFQVIFLRKRTHFLRKTYRKLTASIFETHPFFDLLQSNTLLLLTQDTQPFPSSSSQSPPHWGVRISPVLV